MQQNISKIASKSTPDQSNQLLAKVTEDLPKLEQLFLQQEQLPQAQCSAEGLNFPTCSYYPKADINLVK